MAFKNDKEVLKSSTTLFLQNNKDYQHRTPPVNKFVRISKSNEGTPGGQSYRLTLYTKCAR